MKAPSINDVETTRGILLAVWIMEFLNPTIWKNLENGTTKMQEDNHFQFAVSGNVIYAVLVFSGC